MGNRVPEWEYHLNKRVFCVRVQLSWWECAGWFIPKRIKREFILKSYKSHRGLKGLSSIWSDQVRSSNETLNWNILENIIIPLLLY